MTYWVKKCANCGAINNPSEVLCLKCSVMLPASKVESNDAPPKPSEEAVRAIGKHVESPAPPGQNSESQPTTIQQTPLMSGSRPIQVVVTDLDIPFGQLVWLSAKIMLAALPALMLAGLIVFSIFLLFGGIGGAMKVLFGLAGYRS